MHKNSISAIYKSKSLDDCFIRMSLNELAMDYIDVVAIKIVDSVCDQPMSNIETLWMSDQVDEISSWIIFQVSINP